MNIFILIFFLTTTWLADISCATLCSYAYLQSTLCLSLIMIYQEHALTAAFVGGFLISLFSFLQYGRFGLMLAYLLPIMLFVAATKHALGLRHIMPYILFGVAAIAQLLLIENTILGLPINFTTLMWLLTINSTIITFMQWLTTPTTH